MKNRVVQFAIANAVILASASIANAEAFDNCVREYLDTGMRVEMAEKWCDADSNVHLSKFMSSDLGAKASALSPYKFVNLNTLAMAPLPTTAYPYGLNSHETVVGVINETGKTAQGFIKYKEPATFAKFQVTIGTPLPTTAVAINDFFTVVGHYKPATGLDRGFIKLNGVTNTENFIHPDATYARGGLTRAKDVNNSGEVVGYSARTDTGVLYSWKKVGTTFTKINNGTFDTIVEGNNDKGLVVGHYSSGAQSIGFVLLNDVYVTIQPPGSTGGSVRPLDINNHNQIVGFFTNTAGVSSTFVAEFKSANKTFKYIVVDGTANVPTTMTLNGINDAGLSIGQATAPTARSIIGPTCGFPNQFLPTAAMPNLLNTPDSEARKAVGPFDIRKKDAQHGRFAEESISAALRSSIGSALPRNVSLELDHRGTPAFISNNDGLTGPTEGTPIQVSKRFLNQHKDWFNSSLTAISETPEEKFTLSKVGDSTIVSFLQEANGLPIFQSGLTIAVKDDGSVRSFSGSVAPENISSTSPIISAGEAFEKTISYVTSDGKAKYNTTFKSTNLNKETHFFVSSYNETDALHGASLIYFPRERTLDLAWEVIFHKSPTERYLVVVDAANSEILYVTNLVKNAAPEGKVFATNPNRGSSTVTPFKLDWFDGASLGGNNTCVRENLDGAIIEFPPEGNTSPPKVLIRRAGFSPINDSLVFNYDFKNSFKTSKAKNPSGDINAATTNAFYWVNQMHDYFKSIGFDEANYNFQADNLGKPGKASDEVHVLVQDKWLRVASTKNRNNAYFYTPSDGYSPIYGKPTLGLNLFRLNPELETEDADPAFAADILIHEYAHGVSDRLVSKGGSTYLSGAIQSLALAEGWSDFLAANYLNIPIIGDYVSIAANAAKGLREAPLDKSTKTYRDICKGSSDEASCMEDNLYPASAVWSSALWQTRRYLIPAGSTAAKVKEISTNIAKVVLAGMKTLSAQPSMPAAKSAVVAAANSLYGATYKSAFERALACKGLGTSSKSTSASTITPAEAFDYPGGECLPDLSINPPLGSVPTSIKRGSTFQLSHASINLGHAPAKPSKTRFFLSTNGTDKAVTLGGSHQVPALYAFGGLDKTATTVLTVPVGTVPKSYFVLACPNTCPAGEANCTPIKETSAQNCLASAKKISVTQ